jgi:putative ABC transport system permease protein
MIRLARRGIFSQCRRAPRVASATVGLLALGVAAVMTLFVPLQNVVLADLPFPRPNELVVVEAPVLELYSTSFPNRRSLDPVFSAVMAYRTTDLLVSVLPKQAVPVRSVVAMVTPEFFDTMGIRPLYGGDFAHQPVEACVAIVAYNFWRTRLGAPTSLAGAAIELAGTRYEVVGVAPRDFGFPNDADVWIPSRTPGIGSGMEWVIVGRMLPDLSVTSATTRLKAIVASTPNTDALIPHQRPALQLLRTYVLGERSSLLWSLWSVSLGLLLLVCAGVANLLWAHGLRRRHEMATRLALGASRPVLVLHFLLDIGLLASIGAVVGFGASRLGSRLLGHLMPKAEVATSLFGSPASLMLLAAVVVVATILCGLPPALRSTGDSLRGPLSLATMRPSLAAQPRSSLPSYFAGSQLALAMVLLVSSTLLLRSLNAALNVPLGFEPENVLLLRVDVPPSTDVLEANRKVTSEQSSHRDGPRSAVDARDALAVGVGPALRRLSERNTAWHARVLERLAAMPGVLGVGEMSPSPFTKGATELRTVIPIDPRDGTFSRDHVNVLFRTASSQAFGVLGMHLVAGRVFAPSEMVPPLPVRSLMNAASLAQDVAIVNQTLARRLWPHEDPIGKELQVLTRSEVVGVASDIHESSNRLDVQPTVYLPSFAQDQQWNFLIKLRSEVDPSSMTHALRSSVSALIPGLPAVTVRTMADQVAEPLRSLRLALWLLASLSVVGTLVAALGVYATTSEVAVTRSREMGLRAALGATPGRIRRFALWASLRVLFAAIPVGACGAWLVGRSLSHWLFQVDDLDAVSFCFCAALLIAVTFIASLLPAFRAAVADPSAVLRGEG